MNGQIVELLLSILLPLVKSLMIYYTGNSMANKQNKINNIKKYNEELIKINKLLNDKMEITNEINDIDNRDDIYDRLRN